MAQVNELFKGQEFISLDAFKDFVRQLAIAQHWETCTKDTNKEKARITCRTSKDCPFFVWCRIKKKTGLAVVTSLERKHTCLGAASVERSEVSKLKFLEKEVPRLLNINQKPTGQQVVDAIRGYHGQEINLRQAQRVIQNLTHASHSQPVEDFAEMGALETSYEEPEKPAETNLNVVHYF